MPIYLKNNNEYAAIQSKGYTPVGEDGQTIQELKGKNGPISYTLIGKKTEKSNLFALCSLTRYIFFKLRDSLCCCCGKPKSASYYKDRFNEWKLAEKVSLVFLKTDLIKKSLLDIIEVTPLITDQNAQTNPDIVIEHREVESKIIDQQPAQEVEEEHNELKEQQKNIAESSSSPSAQEEINITNIEREIEIQLKAPVCEENKDVPAQGNILSVQDREQVLECVKKDGSSLRRYPLYINDYHIVLAAVNQNGEALEFASDELKKSKSIVRAAIEKIVSAIQFMDDTLATDQTTLEIALSKKSDLYKEFPEKFKNKIVVLGIIEKNRKAFQFLSFEMRSNFNVALAAVKKNPDMFPFISEKLKKATLILNACPNVLK